MISWYIDSSNNNENYLKKVNEIMEPCMGWLETRLCEEDIEPNNIEESIRKIIENELPILKVYNKFDYVYPYGLTIQHHNELCLRYNSQTIIRFNDGLKGLIREIRLNKILA